MVEKKKIAILLIFFFSNSACFGYNLSKLYCEEWEFLGAIELLFTIFVSVLFPIVLIGNMYELYGYFLDSEHERMCKIKIKIIEETFG